MATRVRHQIITAATLAAVMLYLDRVCIAEIAKLDEFRDTLGLTDSQKGTIMSAFFLTYALSQVPAGWLSDRFGARQMLPMYICVWSLFTLATGLATGFVMLLVFRLMFGIAQAGCYPTAGSLIRRWIPVARRGTASSIVSFGGRMGGAIAPLLTAWLLQDYLSWRGVLILYGLIGFGVAAYFWWICRETPADHPQCDEEERQLIRGDESLESTQRVADFPPILPLLQSGSMWLMCILQFGINLGWVFLVTWLPTYLKDVKHIDPKIGGLMSTVVLAAGSCGDALRWSAHRFHRGTLGASLGADCADAGVLLDCRCGIFVLHAIGERGSVSRGGLYNCVCDRLERAFDMGLHARCGRQGHGGNLWLGQYVGQSRRRHHTEVSTDRLGEVGCQSRLARSLLLFSAGYLVAAVCAIFIGTKRAAEP